MRIASSIITFLFASFCCIPVIQAYDKIEDIEESGSIEADSNFEEWSFQEDVVDLPEYPKKSNLMKISIDAPDASFEYFIDPASLKVGVNGLTAQLTTIIESRSGYQNIYFEKYRCDTREYKTIAYGTSKKTFYQLRDPKWKRVMQRGGTGLDYRRDLITAYLCESGMSALPRDEILYRVKYPKSIPVDDGGF